MTAIGNLSPVDFSRRGELANILDELSHEVYILDTESLSLLYSNKSARQRLGYSAAALQTMTLLDIEPRMSADDLSYLVTCQKSDDQAKVRLKTFNKTLSGEFYPVDGTVKQITFNGKPAYLITVQDVSDRKSNQWTSSSEEELSTIIETTPECVKVIDAGGRLLRMNAAGLEMIGASQLEEVQGKSIYPIIAKEFREQFVAFNRYICAGNKGLLEFDIISLDGERRRVDTHAVPIFDNTSKSVVHLAVTRDVTERKQAVEERLELERQIQHVQKLESLGILAGGIAHDFNNLLTSILGNAELAKRVLSSDDKAAVYLERVVQGSMKAAELTGQMLAYAGKGSFVLGAVHLSTLIDELRPLLDVSVSKKTTITHNFAPNLPPIEGDAAQLQQIIINLIINASEAIEDRVGEISVLTNVAYYTEHELNQTYLSENLPAGMYVYLEVSDNGSGMSARVQKKLFDPFFTTKFTGRGLGLAVVLGIVRGHKGAIQIFTEEGIGTAVRVLFPVSERAASRPDPCADQINGWRSEGTVLVVDDDTAVRELTQGLLENLGFDVLTADNGHAGLAYFTEKATEIRFVLLDMMMPNLNGDEVLEKMSRVQPEIPVILTSGFNNAIANQSDTYPNFFGFLQKPYSYSSFLNTVRRVTNARES